MNRLRKFNRPLITLWIMPAILLMTFAALASGAEGYIDMPPYIPIPDVYYCTDNGYCSIIILTRWGACSFGWSENGGFSVNCHGCYQGYCVS